MKIERLTMISYMLNCTSVLKNVSPRKCLKSVSLKNTSNLFQSRLRDKKMAPLVTPIGFQMMHTESQVTIKVEKDELISVWTDIINDFTYCKLRSDKTKVMERFEEVLKFNVPKGKLIRGTLAVSAFRQLARADQLTDENIRLMQMLAWCIEIFQSFLIIEDDIMDGSFTRRGRPCWHIHNDLGFLAINDSILLRQGLFQFLQKRFGDKPYYLDLVHTFHDCIYETAMGQILDLNATNFGKKPNLSLFTMDRFKAIAKYKTALYTYVLPVTLAMHVAGIKGHEMYRQARNILVEIGQFYQFQDDCLDYFGDPQIRGKVGTDIQEGKCSWLIVVALQRANPEQRKILKESYGVIDPEKVARVKQLYNDLDLKSAFSTYEEESFNLINSHIEKICSLPHSLFFNMMETIYCRRT